MARGELPAVALAPIVAEYARDMNEPSWIVEVGLRRLLRTQPDLYEHPVVSGRLLREIQAVRAEREARARPGRPSRTQASSY